MKPFLTSYSQPSLLSPLRSGIENRCCHDPTYLLKTGLLSLDCFTTWCFAPTRCNKFTPKATTSVSTANFSSKDFYRTQNVSVGSKPLHVVRVGGTKKENRPFYPNPLFLSGDRNNPKNITATNEFSVLDGRKRLPEATRAKQQYYYALGKQIYNLSSKCGAESNKLPSARLLCANLVDRAKGRPKVGRPNSHRVNVVHVQSKGQEIGKEEKKAKRATLGTGLCNAILSNPSDLPARLSKSSSFEQKRSAPKAIDTVLKKSLLPEKFINLLMANGKKDKARRCLTQALFSITSHCQKHNLQNNSPLEIFTDSFFKQESTESKASTADNSLKRVNLPTVQQETPTNELLPLSPKGKSNTLLVPTQSQIYSRTQSQTCLRTKRDANPGKPFNALRDVGLVLLETRLDNLSNGRYSGTRKMKLYPSVKDEKGLLSQAKGTSISRLNYIERVEKRLVLKQNGSFFLFVKQKEKLVSLNLQEKQIGRFKVPLSLPFCGKSFETAFPVFSSLYSIYGLLNLHRANLNNPFLSLIRLSLKERFLTSEKGFVSLALHKKVQQSYLCSALLRLVRTKGNEERDQTLPTKCTRYRTYTTAQTQQIHFLPFLPYSALFNWREKRLNPLFGFAKQSQRFLLELCKAIPNRSVKGTEKIRQNNLFESFPLLWSFYYKRTFSSPFLCVPTPLIETKPVSKHENHPFPMAKNLNSYKKGYVQQDTKLETKGLDKFVALRANLFAHPIPNLFAHPSKPSHQHKQVSQNDSHTNTKETPLCFTQGIPPYSKKVFEREKNTKSVNTEVLLKGIQRVQPTLEVRRVRKGRNTFQVPSVVKQKRGEKVGIKWIIDSAKSKKRKKNKLFSLSLANQLVQSFDRLGEARSKRNELLKLAESNRPFLRFRWW